jgi:hypothetical protein
VVPPELFRTYPVITPVNLDAKLPASVHLPDGTWQGRVMAAEN